MDIDFAAGIIGMVILLITFTLNQLGKWSHDMFIYDLANFVGGALMVYYAITLNSLPFAILNGAWTLVSLKDMIQHES
jgi:hypothetical protein